MDVKNGEEPRLGSKRSADLSPSTTATELKKQKIVTREEGEEKNTAENPEEEQTVATTATAKSKRVEEEQEAVAEGKVELERGGEEGNSNGKAVIDRKGKGILIEEEDEEDEEEEDDSDNDDDSSDGGNVSDGGDDSDFADDPLTEVDLDNILPSRTRRRVVHPGAYISNDLGGADDDDDDSDDSDA